MRKLEYEHALFDQKGHERQAVSKRQHTASEIQEKRGSVMSEFAAGAQAEPAEEVRRATRQEGAIASWGLWFDSIVLIALDGDNKHVFSRINTKEQFGMVLVGLCVELCINPVPDCKAQL